MRFFLTGSTGFIGSRLLHVLLDAGHDVTLLLRRSSDPWRIRHKLKSVRVIEGDPGDFQGMTEAVKGVRVDAVIHLGWYGVPGFARNDLSQFSTNIPIIITILECARLMKAKTFAGLGSQAEYGKVRGVIAEETPADPITLYGKAKNISRMIAGDFCTAAGMRFLWFRLFPLFGPQERPPWLIPALVFAIKSGQDYSLTAGNQVRDYLYVDDAVRGIYAALVTSRARGVYNLGTGHGITIRELASRVAALASAPSRVKFGVLPYRSDQPDKMIADISRISAVTGWMPTTKLEVGLLKTVEELLNAKQ